MIQSYLVLTQYNGSIVGPVARALAYVINGIYSFFAMFGIENAALCIVLFTFIMKALMIPIYFKQQRAGKLTSKMNPELTAITAKYKGKRDPESQRKMQLETQAVYEKYGSNPLSGCLPVLITFPVMIALYRIIQSMPAYMPSIKALYENAANAVMGTNGYVNVLKEVGNSSAVNSIIKDSTTLTLHPVIDILSTFNQEKWDLLADKIPSAAGVINNMSHEIGHIYNVFGLFSIADTPSFARPLTLIIPALAGILQYINGKQMLSTNTMPEGNNQAAAMNKGLMNIMPLIQVFFCYTFPIGIGIYWIAGSAFAILQQHFFTKILSKVDVEDIIKENQKKLAKKRAKRGDLPNPEDFNKFAKTSTKKIAVTETKSSVSPEKEGTKTSESGKGTTMKVKNNYKITDYKRKEGDFNENNISEIANMLKRD